MAEYKIVLTDKLFPTLDVEGEIFKGLDVEFHYEKLEDERQFIEAAKDADGLLGIYFPVTRNAIQHMKKMKVMGVWGVGTNHIDVEAASERGIIVSNVPDYCTDEVASHAVALMLGCARQVSQYDRLSQKGVWAYGQIPLNRFAGKTVGIVGMGAIGQSVARKLSGFDVNVIGSDKYIGGEVMASHRVRKVEMEELVRTSDFISIHAPLTDETRNMFSEAQFKAMKKTAFIINTSRGGLVDEAALKAALDSGEIAGAALDVLAEEPINPNNPLIGHPKITITPHVGWFSQEAKMDCRVKASEAVKAVLLGQLPKAIVNRSRLKL